MRTSTAIFLAVALLLLAPALVQAGDVLKPTKAYSAYLKEKRRMSPEECQQWATEYIESWEATGQKATGAQRYALAQFQQIAGQFKDAATGFRVVQEDTTQKQKTRDYAATAEGGVLLVPSLRASMGDEALDAAVIRLSKYADGMTIDQRLNSRGKLRTVLARLLDMAGRREEAIDLRMKIIAADPAKLANLVRPVMTGLREMTHKIEGYKAMRAKQASVMKTLREHQAAKAKQTRTKLQGMLVKLREINPGALGEDGRLVKDNPREMDKAERAVYSAQRSYDGALALGEKMNGYEKTIALLGTQAQDWTLEKEYGDVSAIADLKGKVVLMDFWITSGGRTNFSVLRDLMKSFSGKPFTVLGVTASSHVVYETRYDIDEDYGHKVERGARKQYAARLATDEVPANPNAAVFEETAYREMELRVIGSFIENHELKWPHVMIDDFEPEEKYALEGWPHILVLDKQGRIRALRSTSLSREKTEMVAGLRKVIEDLLAE